MRRPLVAAAALITVVTVACGDDGPRSSPAIVAVRVSGCELRDELATGIVVADGLVLTVAHVLDGRKRVSVDGTAGSVVAVDEHIDAALITADVRGPAVRFDVLARPGPVTITGNAASVTRVIDADVEPRGGGEPVRRRALVLDVPVRRGDSGAAVVGADGAVRGMVFAVSTGQDSTSYAVDAGELVAFVSADRPVTPPPLGC
ncbi:MAG: trypsin-like peptidase domain-containing protein [Ilumatobacteraceae bacterium]